MPSSSVLIAFLTLINNAKSNKMYLKLAENSLFTSLWGGFPPGRFRQVTQIVTSDAYCVIKVTTLETKFEINKVPILDNVVTKMSERLTFVNACQPVSLKKKKNVNIEEFMECSPHL